MDIPMIINTIINYASIVLAVMAGLVFVTNIIVEVLKVFLPKLPTNYLAVIVSPDVQDLVEIFNQAAK